MHADPNQPSAQPTYDPVARRVRTFGATVFAEFTALANATGAVNLGQGFPNFAAPDFVKEAAQAAIAADLNQYARSAGHPRLVNALAQVYSPLFGRALDPMQEIVVTVGATEGIFATVQALVNPGDEVILIEPFYDSYPASVIMAGSSHIVRTTNSASGNSLRRSRIKSRPGISGSWRSTATSHGSPPWSGSAQGADQSSRAAPSVAAPSMISGT